MGLLTTIYNWFIGLGIIGKIANAIFSFLTSIGDNSAQRIPLIALNRIPPLALNRIPA